MKRLFLIFIIIFLSAVVFGVSIKNKYLEIIVDDYLGRVIIKTVEGAEEITTDQNQYLLCNRGGEPTSFTTVKIDSKIYIFGDADGKWIKYPYIDGNIIKCVWEKDGITFTQNVEFILGLSTGNADTMLLSYDIQNNSSEMKRVGIRIMLDTLLGKKDGVPFIIPKHGAITTEARFEQDELPDYYYAIDSLSKPSLRAQGILKSDIVNPPDDIVVASWPRLRENKWTFAEDESKKFYGDSAIALYFYPKLLSGGRRFYVSTAYGVYSASMVVGDLFNMSLGSPKETKIKPFIVSLILENASRYSILDVEAELSFEKPQNFIIEEAKKNLGNFPKWDIRQIDWEVTPKKSAFDINNFKVEITGSKDGSYKKDKITHKINILNKVVTIASVTPDKYLFSPNNDGKDDTVIFKMFMADASGFEKVKFTILDENYKPVREEIRIGDTMTLFKWDGLSDNNKLCHSGNYYYDLYLKNYQGSEKHVRSAKPIVLDIDPPLLALTPDKKNVLPPADDSSTMINLTLTANEDIDSWKITVADDKSIVKEFSGSSLPSKLSWNGFDKDGMPVHINKEYKFEIKAKDKAGNIGKAYTSITTKDTIKPIGNITTENLRVLPPKKSRDDLIIFNIEASDNYALSKWSVTILEDKKAPIKEFSGDYGPPSSIQWNGICDDGSPITLDKKYYYMLKLEDYGNNVFSKISDNWISVEDKIKPHVSCEAKVDGPKGVLFSPDGDDVADTVSFLLSARDNDRIKKWTLLIRDKDKNVFKTFSGEGIPPSKISWDGIGDQNILVDNGGMYYYSLKAEDFAGNISETENKPLEIDILLTKDARGFKMNFSNITFSSGSAKLQPDAYGILKKVGEVLKRYTDRKILVAGHTDSQGSASSNKKLSIARAQAVVDFLVGAFNIKRENIVAEGWGEEKPVADNSTPLGRAQNRRVEIIILK